MSSPTGSPRIGLCCARSSKNPPPLMRPSTISSCARPPRRKLRATDAAVLGAGRAPAPWLNSRRTHPRLGGDDFSQRSPTSMPEGEFQLVVDRLEAIYNHAIV